MSVDSLISIEPVHTHCMHARIQNILSERTEMSLKIDHHRPISETPLKWRFAGVSWPTIECWLGSFVIFRGSGSILLGTLYFVIFQGSGPPVPPPSGFAHGMHLKEGTCLKCSVIIGRKVGIDRPLAGYGLPPPPGGIL